MTSSIFDLQGIALYMNSMRKDKSKLQLRLGEQVKMRITIELRKRALNLVKTRKVYESD